MAEKIRRPDTPPAEGTGAADANSGAAAGGLRAFRVERDDLLAGYLGSGPGPFVSASRRRAAEARFEEAQFNSSHFVLEREVRQAMRAGALDAVVGALERLGFT